MPGDERFQAMRERVHPVSGLGIEEPPPAHPVAEQTVVKVADEVIQAKWNALGGSPGAPAVPGLEGVIKSGGGYYREYANGRIYDAPGDAAFHVYGAIGATYSELGGPQSWLGWPTSDELPFTEGGRVSTFEHGAIYWWPDTGAIPLANVVVSYAGLVCFGETDWDQGSTADEPYVLFGVVPAPPGEPSSPRTPVYEGVDAGESVRDEIELYRGLPYGLSLSVVLMEHDFGNPDKFRDVVQEAVDTAGKGVVAGVGAIPTVGPFLAPAAAALLKAVGPAIVNEVNGALDTDDDRIGAVALDVSAKDMVRLWRVPTSEIKGVPYHLETPLIIGLGASYKAYFVVRTV